MDPSGTVFFHVIVPIAFEEFECDGSGQWRHGFVFFVGEDFIGDIDFVFAIFIFAKAEELFRRKRDDGRMSCDGASAWFADGGIRKKRDRREGYTVHGVETVERDGLFALEIVVFTDKRFAGQEGGIIADGVLAPMRRLFGKRRPDTEGAFAVRDICSKVVLAIDFEIHGVGMKVNDSVRRDGNFDAIWNICGDTEIGFAPNDVFLRPDLDMVRASIGILRERQLVGDEAIFVRLQFDGG